MRSVNKVEPNYQFVEALGKSVQEAIERTQANYFKDECSEIKKRDIEAIEKGNSGMLVTISSILFRSVIYVSVSRQLQTMGAFKNKGELENDVIPELINLLAGDIKRSAGKYIHPLGMSTPTQLDASSFKFLINGNSQGGKAYTVSVGNVHVMDVYLLMSTGVNMDDYMQANHQEEPDVLDGELELF